jgi:hypothetical protein
MEKHVFGNPVECGTCHQVVSAVWAGSWQDAHDGKGQCDECRRAAERLVEVVGAKASLSLLSGERVEAEY